MTPPWKPPPMLMCAVKTMYRPKKKVNASRTYEKTRTASLVSPPSASRSVSDSSSCGLSPELSSPGCCASSFGLRSSRVTPATEANRMNSSPSVSRAR